MNIEREDRGIAWMSIFTAVIFWLIAALKFSLDHLLVALTISCMAASIVVGLMRIKLLKCR